MGAGFLVVAVGMGEGDRGLDDLATPLGGGPNSASLANRTDQMHSGSWTRKHKSRQEAESQMEAGWCGQEVWEGWAAHLAQALVEGDDAMHVAGHRAAVTRHEAQVLQTTKSKRS
jgi:hypothetical protein